MILITKSTSELKKDAAKSKQMTTFAESLMLLAADFDCKRRSNSAALL